MSHLRPFFLSFFFHFFVVVVVLLLLFLLPVWGCFRSCCDESSEVRPGQILGSQIAIGQAHASGQKKNLEGTVHRGSWDQAWMHLPGRDESSKSSHGAGMAAGGRWQALSLLKGEGGLKGVRGWEGLLHSSAAGATSACEKASWHFCS